LIWLRHILKAAMLSMKRLTSGSLLIFSCFNVWSSDFDKGLATYEASDLIAARPALKLLAEQGPPVTQSISIAAFRERSSYMLLSFYRNGLRSCSKALLEEV